MASIIQVKRKGFNKIYILRLLKHELVQINYKMSILDKPIVLSHSYAICGYNNININTEMLTSYQQLLSFLTFCDSCEQVS